MPRAKKTQADAWPLRGAGTNEAAERDAYRDDTAAPASEAARKRSIQFLHSEAEDDNQQQVANDPRICRLSWPSDPETRRREIVKVLPQAIREYFGNVPVIEYRLSLEEGEVKAVAAVEPQIKRALDRAEELLCALAEDCLAVSIVQGQSSSDARYLLDRRSDKYAKSAAKGNGRPLDLPEGGVASVLGEVKPKPHSEVQ